MPRRLITPRIARFCPRREGERPWEKYEFWTTRFDDDMGRLRASPIWEAAPLAGQMRDLMMKTEQFICWEVRRTKDGPQVGLIWNPKGMREETYVLLDHPDMRLEFTKYHHNVGMTVTRVYVAGGTDRSATAFSLMPHALHDSDPNGWPSKDFYGRIKLGSPEHRAIVESTENACLTAQRHAVSRPEDLMRRRIEMRRLEEALDRMPHPSWGSAPKPTCGIRWPRTSLRYVGDYVYEQLTADERAYLSDMMILADGELDELSDWHDGLGNCGMSTGSGREGAPTGEEMRTLIEDLAEFRTHKRCRGEWSRLIQGLARSRADEGRIRGLFEEGSGITDEMLWGPMESLEAEEEARDAIEALNERRDALIEAGRDVPRAHINWERFHPFPCTQLILPTMDEHVGAPKG